MAVFNIKVVSDTICPWCYLGKKRLERAINVYKRVVPGGDDDTFKVTWHPFYLDPSLPAVGVDPKEHLARKFTPERLAAVHARLKGLGEAEGIRFSLNGKIGNTRDAHRLVQLAKTKGDEAEGRVVGELFRLHFEEDGDVTSREMLQAAGERAGLDSGEINSWLDEGRGGAEVDREVEEAYRAGIHGVPNFTINGRYQVDGAQDVQTFLQEFVRAKDASSRVSETSSKSQFEGCVPSSR